MARWVGCCSVPVLRCSPQEWTCPETRLAVLTTRLHFCSQRTPWRICPVNQASGASLTSNDENFFKKIFTILTCRNFLKFLVNYLFYSIATEDGGLGSSPIDSSLFVGRAFRLMERRQKVSRMAWWVVAQFGTPLKFHSRKEWRSTVLAVYLYHQYFYCRRFAWYSWAS